MEFLLLAVLGFWAYKGTRALTAPVYTPPTQPTPQAPAKLDPIMQQAATVIHQMDADLRAHGFLGRTLTTKADFGDFAKYIGHAAYNLNTLEVCVIVSAWVEENVTFSKSSNPFKGCHAAIFRKTGAANFIEALKPENLQSTIKARDGKKAVFAVSMGMGNNKPDWVAKAAETIGKAAGKYILGQAGGMAENYVSEQYADAKKKMGW